LSLPILISKFGLEKLGVVFTNQALVLMLASIANYSFMYFVPTQSKKISNDKKAFIKLWSLVVNLRFFISLLLSVLSIVIVCIYFNSFLKLWLLSLLLLLPKIINPSLFINALENNKLNFKIGLVSKLVFLISVIFISNSNYINFFLGFSELLVLIGYFILINNSFLKIEMLSVNKILAFAKETINLFFVNFFSMLKPASILPIISVFIGNEFVTLYTLAEKIMNIIRGVSGAMFVSFFPIYNKEKIKLHIVSLQNATIIVFLSTVIVGVMWFSSPYIIYLLNNFNDSLIATKTLRILSLSVPMYFMVVPLFSYLLALDKQNIILITAILQLLVLFVIIFVFHNTVMQIAYAYVVSEYILLLGYYFFFVRLNR